MQKWGKTRQGKQRFYCKICKVSSIRKRNDHREKVHCQLFVEWLTESVHLKKISKAKKISTRWLQKSFEKYWSYEPQPTVENCSPKIIVVDGVSIVKRTLMALIAQDPNCCKPVSWRFSEKECYASWVKFFGESKKQGINPAFIVCDGQRGLLSTSSNSASLTCDPASSSWTSRSNIKFSNNAFCANTLPCASAKNKTETHTLIDV